VRAGNVGDAQPCTRHEKRKKGAKYKKCIKIENQTGCQRQQLDKTGKLTQKKKDSSSLGGNGCTAMAAHSAANSGSPHPTIADMSAPADGGATTAARTAATRCCAASSARAGGYAVTAASIAATSSFSPPTGVDT